MHRCDLMNAALPRLVQAAHVARKLPSAEVLQACIFFYNFGFIFVGSACDSQALFFFYDFAFGFGAQAVGSQDAHDHS